VVHRVSQVESLSGCDNLSKCDSRGEAGNEERCYNGVFDPPIDGPACLSADSGVYYEDTYFFVHATPADLNSEIKVTVYLDF
jgi:hypothetical protein